MGRQLKKFPSLSSDELADLITQSEAARLRKPTVTRAAIGYLVASGRLRSREVFGRRLVYRSDVLAFEPQRPGPKAMRVPKKKGKEKR